jgi:hypothetical protein
MSNPRFASRPIVDVKEILATGEQRCEGRWFPQLLPSPASKSREIRSRLHLGQLVTLSRCPSPSSPCKFCCSVADFAEGALSHFCPPTARGERQASTVVGLAPMIEQSASPISPFPLQNLHGNTSPHACRHPLPPRNSTREDRGIPSARSRRGDRPDAVVDRLLAGEVRHRIPMGENRIESGWLVSR